MQESTTEEFSVVQKEVSESVINCQRLKMIANENSVSSILEHVGEKSRKK